MNDAQFPASYNLKRVYSLSLVVALLMAGASLAGVLLTSGIYPTEEMRIAFLPNDVVNLFIGVPILLLSMWLTRRGSLTGLLIWPGALLYVVYTYLAYVFGTPLSWITGVFLVLVSLSAYSTFDLLRSIDLQSVQERIHGAVPVRSSGWVMIIFGAAFILRALGMFIQASRGETILPASEIGVLIADLVLSIAFLAGGSLLLRRRPLGYASGLGLLFAASTLFIGLIVVLVLQPFLTSAPFALMDVIVVFFMGLICFIPFGLFTRGVLSKGS